MLRSKSVALSLLKIPMWDRHGREAVGEAQQRGCLLEGSALQGGIEQMVLPIAVEGTTKAAKSVSFSCFPRAVAI